MSDELEHNEDVINWDACHVIVGDFTLSDGALGRYYRSDADCLLRCYSDYVALPPEWVEDAI